jgi:hypothetical protein
MDPEKEKQDQSTGEDTSAVVVDLTESDANKQVKPLTADDEAGDKGGNKDQQATGEDDLGNQGGELEDDEPAPTGRKDFDKRLKREMRAKIRERAEKAAFAEENERLRQENEQLRARAPTREEPPNTADIDAKMTTATSALEKALEDGNSKEAARLQAELADLGGQKHVRLAKPARREEPAPRQTPAPVQRKGPTPTGRAFVEANDAWWSDPEQAAVKSAVIAIDQRLINQGSDPASEAHYQRIAKKAKEMGLKVKIRQPFDDGDDMGNDTEVDLDAPTERRRQSAPQGGNGTGRGRVNTEVRDARAGKIILTDKDKETMRIFKLDPTNPQHLRAFAKSRQERVLQEAQS